MQQKPRDSTSKTNFGKPPLPRTMTFLADKGWYFHIHMTSEGSMERFEGDFRDMCAVKLLFVLMGGRAPRQQCADGE